jgi:hypothetical protein
VAESDTETRLLITVAALPILAIEARRIAANIAKLDDRRPSGGGSRRISPSWMIAGRANFAPWHGLEPTLTAAGRTPAGARLFLILR